jgi:hypothetical protein
LNIGFPWQKKDLTKRRRFLTAGLTWDVKNKVVKWYICGTAFGVLKVGQLGQ